MHCVRNSEDVLPLIEKYRTLSKEHLGVLFIRKPSFEVIGKRVVSGNFDSVEFPLNEILYSALNARASGVVVFHNHPVGPIFPSVNDIGWTVQLRDGLNFLGIKLFDHIIIGKSDEGYFSFKGFNVVLRKEKKEVPEVAEKKAMSWEKLREVGSRQAMDIATETVLWYAHVKDVLTGKADGPVEIGKADSADDPEKIACRFFQQCPEANLFDERGRMLILTGEFTESLETEGV